MIVEKQYLPTNSGNLKILLKALLFALNQECEVELELTEIMKNSQNLNVFLQDNALPLHDTLWESKYYVLRVVLAPVFWIFPKIPFFTYKAPILDKTILKTIKKQLKQQLQEDLFKFLDEVYIEFQAFCADKEQSDLTIGCVDIQSEEDSKDDQIHIAVLGTNHIFAQVQLKHLEKKLESKSIDKNKVCIHLLCKSGQNTVIQEAYGEEFSEDTDGEDKEMLKVFEDKGFARVETHKVDGTYVGTKPTLEKFYEDCKEQLPGNLIFLCCPNTLDRQVMDVKNFLLKKQVPQDAQDKIKFLTFNYQETAGYLKDMQNQSTKNEEEQNRISSFLKSRIVLSSFFAEMAKRLYATLQIQKLNESQKQLNLFLKNEENQEILEVKPISKQLFFIDDSSKQTSNILEFNKKTSENTINCITK